MYLPYVFGRQSDLLALREANKNTPQVAVSCRPYQLALHLA
jgi:hypothetical protein